jgi:hypothetical protein
MLNIGLLDPTNGAWTDCIKAFTDQLGTHGWKNGTDYTIQVQAPNGQTVAQAATNLVTLGTPNPADFIILTGGTEPTRACIKATVAVPGIKIFFATAGENGAYFTGLANNVTGISNEQCDPTLVKKRLHHLRQHATPPLAPNAIIGVIGNANAENVKEEIKQIVSQAPNVAQSTTKLNTANDIQTVIQEVQAKGALALYVCTDPLIVTANAPTINQWALHWNLSTMHAFSKNVRGNADKRLLYHGFELTDLFSQVADIIYNWRTTGVFPTPTTPVRPPKHRP